MRPWKHEPFEKIISDKSAGSVKTPQSEFRRAGQYPIVDQGKELIAGYTDDQSRLCHAELPVIVFGDHTRAFKYIDFPFCIGADGVKILRPKADANVKYLYYYLRQVRLPEGGYDRHFKYLKRSTIAIPPLKEQQRLVEILDGAEALQVKRRAALAQCDALVDSVFLDMFGSPLTNPKSWPRKSVGKIGEVTTGNTPSRANPDYFGDAIEWIKPGNLNTPAYWATQAEEGLSAAGRAVARTAPPNAILVTCIAGSPQAIGNVAMTEREVAFNQQINALVPHRDDPHFLYAQIRIGKRLIQASSTGGMKGLVSKSRFEQISLVVPPLPLQREFAARMGVIENLRTAQRRSVTLLEDLFAALQESAFSGGLV